MSTALHSRPRAAEARALAGAVLFWLSSLAVGGATFVVLAVLSPHLPAGGLAAVSVVLGLSYVLAVPPGAIQLRAAAAASSPGRRLTLRPPRLVTGLSAALLVVSPLAAAALKIPLAAVVLASVQLPLAAALGSARGTLIGQRCLTLAAASFGIDAACRLFSGAVLGIVWGASGVAAALVLATLLALLAARPHAHLARHATSAGPTSILSYMLAVSVIVLLTNVDVLLGPRVLGAGADGYAVAALPAKGIFFALFSVSWLAVSVAVNAQTGRQLVDPRSGDARARSVCGGGRGACASPASNDPWPGRATSRGARAVGAGDGRRRHHQRRREHGGGARRSQGVDGAAGRGAGARHDRADPTSGRAAARARGAAGSARCARRRDLGAAQVPSAGRARAAGG